jgi:two-component system, cell cycle response regulator CpdR
MPTPPRATTLVVDDLESMLVMLHRQLTGQGHTVLTANNGADAIESLRRVDGMVDLVLSDVVMPGMNGTELVALVAAEFPGLPIVLMSAYAAAGMTRVGLGEVIVPVLPKPFGEHELAELVEAAVALRRERQHPSAEPR